MTTERFVLALTRKMSRRGKIDVIGLTTLNHLKTLTKGSANAGKSSEAMSHRKGSRVVVFVGS